MASQGSRNAGTSAAVDSLPDMINPLPSSNSLTPTLDTPSSAAPGSAATPIAAPISMAMRLEQHRAHLATARVQSKTTTSSGRRPSPPAPTPLLPVPEDELVRDIIYIFQGIDGRWFQLASVSPESTAAKVSFTPSTTHYISAPRQELLDQLAELGALCRALERAIEAGTRRSLGRVEQSLHAALGVELLEHYRLVAVLEGQLKNSAAGSGAALTLRRLLVWTDEMRLKMRMMSVFVGGHGGRVSFHSSLVTSRLMKEVYCRWPNWWSSIDLSTFLHVERRSSGPRLFFSTIAHRFSALLFHSLSVDL